MGLLPVNQHCFWRSVGAPPEIACLLDEIQRENDVYDKIDSVSTCVGADPELDEFMETYCDILVKYKSDLSRPFDEATSFLSKIEAQLGDLCKEQTYTWKVFVDCSSVAFYWRKCITLEFDWATSYTTSKKWIRNPMNMALLLWMICVAVSGAILFFVMTGMLNGVLPKKSQRNEWFEVNNQIINALFTLMCLFQHPKRFHHLALLFRWKQDDISRLRKIYCKDGTYKPHEWCHMMVVIILLHINCFAQYSLCALNLVYKRSERPPIGVAICVVIAVAAPAVAGLYCILSPLGREYELEVDEEEPDRILTVSTNQTSHLRAKVTEKRLSFESRSDQTFLETGPKWRGGLLDIWEDITVAYLSLFCTFCVFGWNMQRLGFGNMYVHIATFLLFCMAPFWIFNLAAVNVDNDTARAALGMTGVILSLLGLLYGGFWRIQMRKRFNLPPNNSCCGIPEYTDCIQWLCCCWCSLAQEVRTADYYDIVEDKLCGKQMNTVGTPLSPLSRENGLKEYRFESSSPSGNSPTVSMLRTEDLPGPSRFSRDHFGEHSTLQGATFKDEMMNPPVPSLIQREDDSESKN